MKHYAIVVYWSDEDAVWIAEVPDLEPCAAHGKTPEAAVAELRVTMQAWLEVARENGLPIPEPRFHWARMAAE
ncbi:MAG TPA: type II toxin-antitoxin system HicB family antitoxin [Pseudolabrys sp.]|jgi:predicted RNase H-like HicB family nuclease|nr:type II toxin-antitoxin system HicB family antitoxin [Pseudolabrys sp.]